MKTYKIFIVAFSLILVSSCCGSDDREDDAQKCVVLTKGKGYSNGRYYIKFKDIKNDSIHAETVEEKLFLTYNVGDTVIF